MQSKNTIHSLIKAFCEGSIKPEMLEKSNEKLIRLLKSVIPEYLYRYRVACDYNLDSFMKDEIYLSEPASFNDPTDCKMLFSSELLLRTNLMSDAPQEPEGCIGDYRTASKQLLRSIEKTNDGIDIAGFIPNAVRVACFSEEIMSPLMWSHYADNHKGFALRYSFREYEFQECKQCPIGNLSVHPEVPLYPVFYRQKRTDMTQYLFNLVNAIELGNFQKGIPYPYLSLIEKGKDWKYEKEWRLICEAVDLKKLKAKPNGLYLGCKVEAGIKKELISLARQKDIEVFETYIDYKNPYFSMGIKPMGEINGVEL